MPPIYKILFISWCHASMRALAYYNRAFTQIFIKASLSLTPVLSSNGHISRSDSIIFLLLCWVIRRVAYASIYKISAAQAHQPLLMPIFVFIFIDEAACCLVARGLTRARRYGEADVEIWRIWYQHFILSILVIYVNIKRCLLLIYMMSGKILISPSVSCGSAAFFLKRPSHGHWKRATYHEMTAISIT